MIAYVKGTLEEIAENNAVVETGGIGYNIKISAGTMNRLPRLHEEVRLYTYTAVREDAFWLYGFLSREELELFRLLITVNGVGPRGALGILSVMSVSELQLAILSGDGKMLSRAPGIGKKTAERLILDLRDKVSLSGGQQESLQAVAVGAGDSAREEAVEALVALGYGAGEAMKAVKEAAGADGMEDADTESILKAALKKML